MVETWPRGDTDNDDDVGFADIDRALDGFDNTEWGTGTPPLTPQMVDVFGTENAAEQPTPIHTNCEPQGPDEGTDLKDIAAVVDAFAGNRDPCDDPLEYCADSPPNPSIPPRKTVTVPNGMKLGLTPASYFTARSYEICAKRGLLR